MKVRFIPTREFLESRTYSTDSNFIILYTQNSPSLEVLNSVALNAQDMLNYTIPELKSDASFEIADNFAIPALESSSNFNIDLKSNKSIDKYVAYNSSTSIVDFVGVFNHSQPSLVSYPSQEYYTSIDYLSTNVWLGCYNTQLNILQGTLSGYFYTDTKSKTIWEARNTYIDLQNITFTDFLSFFLATNVSLSNFESGSNVDFSGIFLSNESNTNSLVLYASLLFDSDYNQYETVSFPEDTELLFSELYIHRPEIVVI